MLYGTTSSLSAVKAARGKPKRVNNDATASPSTSARLVSRATSFFAGMYNNSVRVQQAARPAFIRNAPPARGIVRGGEKERIYAIKTSLKRTARNTRPSD